MKIISSLLFLILIASTFPSQAAGRQELPEGPYQSSCVRCQMSLGILACDCPTKSNQMAHSEIRVTQNCKAIWNQNGKLVCD